MWTTLKTPTLIHGVIFFWEGTFVQVPIHSMCGIKPSICLRLLLYDTTCLSYRPSKFSPVTNDMSSIHVVSEIFWAIVVFWQCFCKTYDPKFCIAKPHWHETPFQVLCIQTNGCLSTTVWFSNNTLMLNLNITLVTIT